MAWSRIRVSHAERRARGLRHKKNSTTKKGTVSPDRWGVASYDHLPAASQADSIAALVATACHIDDNNNNKNNTASDFRLPSTNEYAAIPF
jgi:hypothetical protein